MDAEGRMPGRPTQLCEFERCGSGVRTKAKHVWMSASNAPDLTDHLFVQPNANLCRSQGELVLKGLLWDPRGVGGWTTYWHASVDIGDQFDRFFLLLRPLHILNLQDPLHILR